MTDPAGREAQQAFAQAKSGRAIITFPGGRLEPITESTDATASLLAAWRRDNAAGFTTRFPVTDAGTRAWLQHQVIDNPRRALFLLVDDEERPVGHLGFMSGSALGLAVEIDNVLRGEPAPAGFMRRAVLALLEWLATHGGTEPVGLRVLASNRRALSFYEKCGFREINRINLTERRDNERVSLVPGESNVVDQYVTMTRDPKARPTDDVESP